jgi:hypothetical protein
MKDPLSPPSTSAKTIPRALLFKRATSHFQSSTAVVDHQSQLMLITTYASVE